MVAVVVTEAVVAVIAVVFVVTVVVVILVFEIVVCAFAVAFVVGPCQLRWPWRSWWS